jgi:hypothetical protein
MVNLLVRSMKVFTPMFILNFIMQESQAKQKSGLFKLAL